MRWMCPAYRNFRFLMIVKTSSYFHNTGQLIYTSKVPTSILAADILNYQDGIQRFICKLNSSPNLVKIAKIFR